MLNETEICNYADDTTIYCSHQELQEVTIRSETDTAKLSTWFAGNFMKLIEEKCHLSVFCEKDAKGSIKADSSVIKESNEKELLGVIIDRKLNFKQHLFTVCKKASQKLHALARASMYMPKGKTRLVMKAIVISKFTYFTLVCMFTIEVLAQKLTTFMKEHEQLRIKILLPDLQNY